MFNLCQKLKSLDLSYFDASSVTDFEYMFSGCYSLISLDLSNFHASSAINMYGMFYSCDSLITLDLSNFNTSSASNMYLMFSACNSLISLDISNFNTLSVTDMEKMFYGYRSLISLNLRNFNTLNVNSLNNILDNINNNLIYCINESTMKPSILLSLNSSFFNCSDICFDSNHKILIEQRKCVIDCPDSYKFEYNKICYESCPIGTHISSYNEYLCEKYLICKKYYNYNHTEYII